MAPELYDMPEPDGPLTEEQLTAVARTHYYHTLMRHGLEPQEIDGAWERLASRYQANYVEIVRGPVVTANSYWGRHVRRHQAELVRREGQHADTLEALFVIITDADDPMEAARTLINLLGLR